MVLIPAGEFKMGSNDPSAEPDEKPSHPVSLDAYWIYKTPVTVAQYKNFCDASPGCRMPEKPRWGWKNEHPMVNVTYAEAAAYCKWAGGRLPTEAEWEKAARGKDGRVYPWGNAFDRNLLWSSKAGIGDVELTAPVGVYASGASPYGALDMAGNVWQWTSDWYQGDYYQNAPDSNPLGPDTGDLKVLRGGSWADVDPKTFRTSHRFSFKPDERDDALGFRCVVKP
jgi:formylglycine-generating enzyme required for sulfatase activity